MACCFPIGYGVRYPVGPPPATSRLPGLPVCTISGRMPTTHKTKPMIATTVAPVAVPLPARVGSVAIVFLASLALISAPAPK